MGKFNFSGGKFKWGWVDYNDVATIASPIPLTLADTDYQLTNDGLGPNTRKGAIIPGHGEVWDVDTDLFDFSSLAVNDVLLIRVDLDLHASGPTRDFDVKMTIGLGSGTEITLDVLNFSFKNAGDYHRVREFTVYIGADFVKNNPAKLTLRSDGTGDSVTVHGWYVETKVR